MAVMPTPRDLTPADTSSTVAPGLAAALRAGHPQVAEIVVGQQPTNAEIAGARSAALVHDVVVVGTISASFDPAQARLVDALLGTGVLVVTVALRTPWDLAAYPAAQTHVATHSILRPSMEALAEALFGRARFVGRLPVAIDGLYPLGHRLTA